MKPNFELSTYYVDDLVRTIFRDVTVWKATKYISPNFVVKATRKRFGAKINPDNLSEGICEICLTLGRPNYAEREFIKLCKKAGEKFPVKNIQIKRGGKREYR
jgi:hypothetical protein